MPALLDLDRQKVLLDSLLLDPNNPRFFELRDWKEVKSNLYHLETVQNAAFQRLEGLDGGEIQGLQQSIRSNGFIAAETIVAKVYEFDPSKYIVIEGNRRLAALRSIRNNTLDPNNDVLYQSIQEIDILIYTPIGDDKTDKINEMILQGIRHIGGPKEWGAYQKANLVVELHENLGQSFTQIGERIALSAIMIGRYYRAFKALSQMSNDEDYKQYAGPRLFTLFDEAVKSTAIRSWLGWSEEEKRFTKRSNLLTFYSLLVGDVESDLDPAITNPHNMRNLGELLSSGNEAVLNRFLQREVDVDDAARIVKPVPVSVPLNVTVQAFLDTLAKYPAEKIVDITDRELILFQEVKKKLQFFEQMQQAMANLPNHSI